MVDQERAVSTGQLARGIGWRVDPAPATAPTSDVATRQIVFHEPFLASLWALCFSLLLLEEEVRRHALRATDAEYPVLDPRLVGEGDAAFRWAISLGHTYSPWPNAVPEPSEAAPPRSVPTSDPFTRADYVGFANALFIDAAAYFAFHERTHIVQGHHDFITAVRAAGVVGPDDAVTLQLLEREADVAAREALLDADTTKRERFQRGLAVVAAHCAALFMLRQPDAVRQRIHPDVDDRLLAALQALQPPEVGHGDALWLVAALACRRFLEVHGLASETTADDSPAADARDLLMRYLDAMDRLKTPGAPT